MGAPTSTRWVASPTTCSRASRSSKLRPPYQMIARHLQDVPVPLSRRGPWPVHPDLERLVLACLAKRPEDRPGSAPELDRLLSQVAVPAWTQEDARAWWDRTRAEDAGIQAIVGVS